MLTSSSEPTKPIPRISLTSPTPTPSRPKWAPVEFDCKVRRLAYERAQSLMPWKGTFLTVFDALELGSTCDDDPRQRIPNPLSDIESSKNGFVYVDSIRGSDIVGVDGSLNNPFRTIPRALSATRAEDSTVSTIVLRDGVHRLQQPLIFMPGDSGLTLQSFKGEKAIISGASRLLPKWKQAVKSGIIVWVTDVEVAEGALIKESPKSLLLNGKAATRARYPNNPHPQIPSHGKPHTTIGNGAATWLPPKHYPNATVVNGPFSRDTASHFQNYSVGIGGPCSIFDPPVSFWCGSTTKAAGNGGTFKTPMGLVVKDKKTLPNSPYHNATGAIVFVWHYAAWENWMYEVGKYNAENITFHFARGGFQGGRGNNVGYNWYIENVWEELDAPNEYFYNPVTNLLYLVYNGTGPPPENITVEVPNLRTLVEIHGSQEKPVQNIRLLNLTFTATSPSYMDPHSVPSGGDWALARSAAVFAEGTESLLIDNCIFEHLGGNGLMISGYARNATVQRSEFAWIGGTAASAWGKTNDSDLHGNGMNGTDGNQPRQTTIRQNIMREVGIYEKQSSFWFQAKACQTTLAENVMFNAPRAGVNWNDGFGGANIMRDNLLFNCVRETTDHGPINVWDRQPFLTNVRNRTPSLIPAWSELERNFVIANYNSQEAFDTDDGAAFWHAHNNFFVYGTGGLKSDHGGHDMHHFNNIYGYVKSSCVGICNQRVGYPDAFYNNTCIIADQTDSYASYQCNKGAPLNIHNNCIFNPNGTTFECGVSLAEWQKLGHDLGTTVAKLPLDDDIIIWARTILNMSV